MPCSQCVFFIEGSWNIDVDMNTLGFEEELQVLFSYYLGFEALFSTLRDLDLIEEQRRVFFQRSGFIVFRELLPAYNDAGDVTELDIDTELLHVILDEYEKVEISENESEYRLRPDGICYEIELTMIATIDEEDSTDDNESVDEDIDN